MEGEATRRSTVIGAYFKFKGASWLLLGSLLWAGADASGGISNTSPMRLFAVFVLVFAVPGILLWMLGIIVKMRYRVSWFLGMAYMSLVLIAKTSLGFVNAPLEAWYVTSNNLPPEYMTRLIALGIFSAAVFALDVATFVVMLSPRGRACFRIGKLSLEHELESNV
jgi:hypothetical protein